MGIKMIVCDMDGTLLNSENKILQKTKEILLKLQEKGITIVLASGRGYLRLLPDAMELQLHKYNGFLIDVNGTSVYDVQNKERNRIAILDEDNINEINQFFSNHDVEIQYSQDDGIYTYLTDSIYTLKRNIRGEMNLPDDYPWTGGMYSWFTDTRDGYPNQFMIRNLKDSPLHCNKISIVQDPPYIEVIRQTIEESSIMSKYEFVSSDPRKIEITNKGISKGHALNILMQKLGVSDDEVILFGDSENDISMFKNKKYTVAMANSLPIAKKKANFHTDDHNSDGIYEMLKKFEKLNIL